MSTDPRVARTLQKVLAASYELLTEVGFDGVTIELISERSGVSRSTLYRHWRSRDHLLRDAFSAHSVTAPTDGADLRASLRHWTVSYSHGMAHAWGRAMVSLSVSALDDPAQRALQQEWIAASIADVQVLLDRAVEGGELDEPAEAATVVPELIAPLLYRYLISGDELTGAHANAVADAALVRLLDPHR